MTVLINRAFELIQRDVNLCLYRHAQGVPFGFRDILSRFGRLYPPRCRDDVEEVPGNPGARLGPAFINQETVAVAFHSGREGDAGKNAQNCFPRLIDRDAPLINLLRSPGNSSPSQ